MEDALFAQEGDEIGLEVARAWKATQDRLHALHVDRLDEVVGRAHLERADRRLHRRVAGDNDDFHARARVEVFDAPDAECASIDDLVSVPADAWPALRFSAIPAIQSVRTQYPVHRLWSDDKLLYVPPAKTSLRVWRKNEFLVLHAPMDERESAALPKIISGETFAAICETFADLPEMNAAREATGLLARWLEDGIVARIDGAA